MASRSVWTWVGLIVAIGLTSVAPVAAQEGGPPPSLAPQSRTSADISLITSSSPFCYQVNPVANRCLVNWEVLRVTTAAPAYMDVMTVTIDSRVRAVYRGFFSRTIDASSVMQGTGFIVPCGAFGAGGDPNTGLKHGFTIRARDTDGLKSANYGIFTCPGVRLVYLPVTLRS